MGSVCKKQDPEEEINGHIPKQKERKLDTITIPNASPGTGVTQKNSINKGEYDGSPDRIIQVEPKRADKKKMAKIDARGDDNEIYENITKSDKKKNPFDYQLILNAFLTNSLFSSLQQADQETIVEKMFYCTTPDGQFVFKQGDPKASSFFLIERGQCQIVIDGEVKKVLKQCEYFGERALLYNAPRSASVKAVGDCAFWAIDRNTFRKMIEDIRMKEYEENKQFLHQVKLLDSFTEEQRTAISSVLFTLVYKKGEIIVTEGEPATSFFIIKKGSVAVYKGDKHLRNLVKGESFGEQALIQNSSRGASVKAAEEDVRCLVISRDELTKILGDKIQVVMYANKQVWAIQKHPKLGQLTTLQIQKIVQSTNQFNYKNDQSVFEDTVEKLVIVLKGDLIYDQSKEIAASTGQIYGDKFLEGHLTLNQPVQKILAKDETILAEISFKQFYECIGGSLEQVFKKNQTNHERYMVKQRDSQKKDYSNLKLEDFVSLKKLGQGQFGNVYLVRNKDQSFYALKCISKQQIVEQHLEKHLAQEKSVLQAINFPLMMHYYRSFQDNNYIFFLVQYIRGMELFDVIREIGLLNTFDSQFYVGSLILCIEYLNKQQIIYRDIKPENIMVDEKGYIRLIDMGTAKYLNHKGGRTYTIIGTPHYMAPEILQGKGYSFPADLWSIGVCMYEFMCGCVPYAEEAEDPYEIYEEIQKKPLSYPQFLKDRKAKKMMDQLLQKTPELRLGSSFAHLKTNQWFDQFDWDKLLEKELKAPYVAPANKLTPIKDLQKAVGKPLVQELSSLTSNNPYRKDKAKDPNWDKDY
ncbi:hypothetical protein pb186bvf_016184 [Paramecium bursaria]